MGQKVPQCTNRFLLKGQHSPPLKSLNCQKISHFKILQPSPPKLRGGLKGPLSFFLLSKSRTPKYPSQRETFLIEHLPNITSVPLHSTEQLFSLNSDCRYLSKTPQMQISRQKHASSHMLKYDAGYHTSSSTIVLACNTILRNFLGWSFALSGIWQI